MTRRNQFILITLACVGVFVGLRSLPVEKCEFLHYGDYINAEGAIEGCGYEETEFFDMTAIRFPIIAGLSPLTELKAGELARFELTLFTTTGKPIIWEDVAISHTERIHAMVIDPSLQDYHHVHPQPAGPDGHYFLELTPERAGNYSVYLDFIPLLNSRRTLLRTEFTVEGEGGTPLPGEQLAFSDETFSYTFLPVSEDLVAGEELTFSLEVTSQDGGEVIFTPVMDSFAHVVAFDEAGKGFAHLHPINPFVEGQDPADPDLEFTFLFDEPGFYRVWAQIVVNGQHTFVPFDLKVGKA